VEREGAQPSLHQRLMRMLARGAEAHKDSHAIIARHAAVDREVEATLEVTRHARAQRARARDVRIRTGDDRNRFPSG
jgi:hypothetical protein